MKVVTRRWILGIGGALLIGGWGITRYAHERADVLPERVGISLWFGEWPKYVTRDYEENVWGPWPYGLATRSIYIAGALSMTLGAGLVGFAIPRAGAQPISK